MHLHIPSQFLQSRIVSQPLYRRPRCSHMAAIAPIGPQLSQPSLSHPPPSKLTTVKALSESSGLSSIPSIYTFPKQPNHEPVSDTKEPIPTIDFSLLISSNPDERSKTIRELGKACGDWGFFMVTNHGVPERMMKAMIEVCREFFELTEEEKGECEGKHWIKFCIGETISRFFSILPFTHPAIPLPSARTRHGVARSLRPWSFDPSHPNDTVGLQVLHKDKWVNIHPIPNSFLANIGDHIELQQKNPRSNERNILSNRKYKSVLHRAVVNDRDARISIALAHGPAMDAAVSPAPMLLEDGQNPLAYRAMKYKEYVELQQSNKFDGKSCLEHIRNRGI
ncbi:hypothetical protein GOBAR_AA20503 [Gossypium barbadense]|uniref:Fe2OG dioxygenase domain-containing protein n=1 Tax=Gossypium barbadense TaxID=3634 RepID=A0A2P5XA12_GOSBA|nr:hypothetical protein GOBAR_AA20503 [Gossypium barbadense]